MRVALLLCGANALAPAADRWKPYLAPGQPPLRDNQAVLRFYNVPPSAVAPATPSKDCFGIAATQPVGPRAATAARRRAPGRHHAGARTAHRN